MAAPSADEALERLYASYGREVYRYALALLRNPAEAEDVTQTTFLNAYRALRAGARPRRPHNWLIAIAHNACRSRVRLVLRRPQEVPLDDLVEQLAVPEAERPNIRELMHTIRRLPFNQRAAITMRELEGRSYVDIAETLGVTVPAAEALIGRARRTLRRRAAAFRSLLLGPLPRKLAGNREAAGGAVGTAAAVKIAALVVVGAIGGGVGVAAGSSSPSRPARVALASAPAAAPHSHPKPTPLASPAPAHRARSAIGESTVFATTAAVPAAAPPAVQAAAAGATAAPGSAAAATTITTTTAGTTVENPVAGAVSAVTQAVTTVVSALPTITTPSATTPPATTPPVTTPAVTTPVATVPPVRLPPVTVPPVTVPFVTVPTLP